MAKLTAAERKKLTQNQFALPGRRYPIPDASHAKDAKARAAQMYAKGFLTKAELALVNKKADEVIAKENANKKKK